MEILPALGNLVSLLDVCFHLILDVCGVLTYSLHILCHIITMCLCVWTILLVYLSILSLLL